MTLRKQKDSLERQVFDYIQANNLICPGQKIVVAVSGGPDSICLLHILFKLQIDLQIYLHVAHLDHTLRGQEAEEDARYVAALVEKLGMPATIEKRDVKAYQKANRLSMEEAAREVRYSFLAETAAAVGAERVAVGHTLDDQAETILLHIIRGTGTRGLRGLQPGQHLKFSNRELMVIRPLLEVPRDQTLAYCELHELFPRTDSTNQSVEFLRNRVRHELMPLLKDYNTGITKALLRISRIASDDLSFLEAAVEKAWKTVVKEQAGYYIFDKHKLLSLAQSLKRLLLLKAIGILSGTLKDIETRHIEGLLDGLAKPSGRRNNLPGGLIFCVEYDRFILGFKPVLLSPLPGMAGEHQLIIPGKTHVPGWKIEAALEKPEKAWESEKPDSFTACLDSAEAGKDIKIRALHPGDRFQPLGLKREKKVSRFLLDAHVPRSWRGSIPIFYTTRQIIWVAGYRLDDRVKVTAKTQEVLRLRLSYEKTEVKPVHAPDENQ